MFCHMRPSSKVLLFLHVTGENQLRILEELAKNRCLDKLEKECNNEQDFSKREVGFCAQWCLDNLCECSVNGIY